MFISQTKAIELQEPFDDGRSIAAKRYRTAQQGTKPEMVNAMVKRALNAGIIADYLLADAWFGTKAMIRLSQETALVPVLRMKKNNLFAGSRYFCDRFFRASCSKNQQKSRDR